MKRILVVHYSQSGQLDNVLEHFTRPLADAEDIELVFENAKPQEDYPFPWPFFRFIDTFPESVYLDPPPMQASLLTGDEEFDLIIVAYQVWFLSPSLPITGFMKSATAKKLFKGKPVVTLIACRNMWLMAQEEMKKMIAEMDGRLVGNVALVDEAGSIGSFIATPAWVLSGNKGPRLWGLIPQAGVSERDIKASSRFGSRILDSLRKSSVVDESLLQGINAVHVDETLIFSEQAGRRSFLVWGRLFRVLGAAGSLQRKVLVVIYTLFLLALIVTVVPLGIVVRKLFSPLMRERTARQKAYYGKPSGY
ncbi:MAG: dialkylresorcinol condensing enzyme [Pseudomonadales bacterium]|nr:dialkylresorcinol condensing enzyme [Pseudomonadales bacterium]MCP5170683.1 dialkylresorcinol condensing enzyme [Pseudomonadales bacterium]MCP5302076.1 dialkylresorcinol condensing enzyme [Pseudomonadales bacterium]